MNANNERMDEIIDRQTEICLRQLELEAIMPETSTKRDFAEALNEYSRLTLEYGQLHAEMLAMDADDKRPARKSFWKTLLNQK